MSDSPGGLDFSTVIASTVHDMKNSLAMLMQAHSQWLSRLPAAQAQGPEQAVVEHEFAHLNGMLVQLLGLYKLGVNQLPMCPDYHDLDDFIETLLLNLFFAGALKAMPAAMRKAALLGMPQFMCTPPSSPVTT